MDETSEVLEAVAVCGARASECICIGPPEHVGHDPHACKCGGSWRGSLDGDDFEVVTLPDLNWADSVRKSLGGSS